MGKAPGTDGLPSEIYKMNGDVLLLELLMVLNQAYATLSLPSSIKYANIVVNP